MATPHMLRAIITRQVVGDPAILAAACGAVAMLAYTLNREDTWSHALALGVDGFITDETAALGNWLGGRP